MALFTQWFCKVYPESMQRENYIPKNFKHLRYNSQKLLPVWCFTFLKKLIAGNSDKYQKEENKLVTGRQILNMHSALYIQNNLKWGVTNIGLRYQQTWCIHLLYACCDMFRLNNISHYDWKKHFARKGHFNMVTSAQYMC